MKKNIIKSLLVTTLGVLSIGVVTPIVISSCGKQEEVPVKSITLSNGKISLNNGEVIELTEGETKQLTATILPADATNKELTWTSGDWSVVKFNSIDHLNGFLTAISSGETTITVKTSNDEKITCKVVVKPKKQINSEPISKPVLVESVKLNKSELKLVEGETEQLTATILPEDATNKKVTWSTTNPYAANIDDNGKVTATGIGSTIITATTQDGSNQKATCKIDVTLEIPARSVQLDQTEIEIHQGETGQLTATLSPGNATSKVTWISSDPSIANVNQDGLIAGIRMGEVVITAIINDKDGGKTATCQVKVVEESIPALSIDLDNHRLEMIEGQIKPLTATISPEDATNKKVTWKSSDESIATVDDNGKVTAVKIGNAIITATTINGSHTATCEVIVNPFLVKSVQLDNSEIKLVEGDTKQLIAKATPEDATNKNVIWASDDQSVVKVDQTGLVKAVTPGTAIITVTTQDGSHKIATCQVEVLGLVKSISLSNDKLEIIKGKTEQLTATVFPENANNKEITWKTSAESVATVDQNGLVKAVSEGTATITAIAKDGSGKIATCEVTVKPISVESVELNKSAIELVDGKTEQLTVTIFPADAANKKATWKSSDSSIATVDQTGLVTAVSVGSTTVTITTQDGGKTATCQVKVIPDSNKVPDISVAKTPIPVEIIQLDQNELGLFEGETKQLKATILPADATNKEVIWSSSDSSIAKVSSKGLVTAVSEGNAIITIKNKDSGKTAYCKVTVGSIHVKIVQLNKSEMELIAGETGQLTATVLPANATNKKVIWSSNNPSIATVDQNGLVTAVSEGNAIIAIEAEDGSITAYCKVNVSLIHVHSVKLDNNKLDLFLGKVSQLTATVYPETATNKNITWSSSDYSIVDVNQDGLVSAVGEGIAIITVTTEDGNQKATCKVTVKPILVKEVQLDKNKLELFIGKDSQLTATISPADATDKNVTWSSSDHSVATVDDNGKVTAVKIGNAIITVTTKDGGKTATCEVTVKPIPIENIQLNKDKLELLVGKDSQLIATVLPKTATNKKVTWKSSDEKIAKVDQKGLVTAIAKGTVTIIVKAEDGGKTATCEVTVKPILVEKVQLNESELGLFIGNNSQLTATVLPEDATNKKVTWSSNNEKVATVDQKGLIKAVNIGTAIITVTTVDGSKTATCKVDIAKEPILVENVKLDKNKLELVEGQAQQLIATILPEEATNKKVTWSSSDEKIAKVDQKGLVTGVKMGKAIIIVTTQDGGKTATCEVTTHPEIHALSVEFSIDKLELYIHSIRRLNAIVLPRISFNKKVTWKSSDEKIAKVDENGWVTAVSVGNATITVTTVDGNKTATCQIIVKPIWEKQPVESIQLNKDKIELAEGYTDQLTATILPKYAVNKNVIWTSSDENIVTVSQNGLVKAARIGNATITVTARDGSGQKATCEVKVVKPVLVKSVRLNKNKLELVEGDQAQLKAKVLPENASNKKIIWTSSDDSVATVDQNGLVTAVGPGSFSIIVTSDDGSKEAICKLGKVKKLVVVEDVKFDKNELELTEGYKEQLTATIYPADATNKKVTWSSNDESIATVDQNGLVTGIKMGTATITVTTQDGGKTATCKVKIVPEIYLPVRLNKSEIELFSWQTMQLILTAGTAHEKITWTSDNLSVARVDQNGLVTAINPGIATITATIQRWNSNKTATCKVIVRPIKLDQSVQSVQLNKDKIELITGEIEPLKATVLPEDAANKLVTWSSSDEKVATVNKNGLVNAIAEGTATVTVTTEDGSKTATCKVVVTKIEKVQISRSKINLYRFSIDRLTATVFPETLTNKKVYWHSSDENIVTVDQNGYVKAVGTGVTTIVALAGDLTHAATCEVIVKDNPSQFKHVESVQLDIAKMVLAEGKTKQLAATVLPWDATNKNVTWFSSDEKVVTVYKNGVIVAVGKGHATITVRTMDLWQTATCEIEVVEELIPVKDIQLDKSELELIAGQDGQLKATILPENASNKNVIWSSDDPHIVKVDSKTGQVKAINVGKATIIAKALDGSGKTATCIVIVKPIPVNGIIFDKTKLELVEGKSQQLTVTVLPANAKNKNVTWKSSDESIAIVDKNGLVKAVKVGKVIITVTTIDGGKTATCEVIVKPNLVENVKFETEELELVEGETEQLTATVLPKDATNKKVTWISSDKNVVVVDQDGLVKAIRLGQATISVIIDGKTANCKIKVVTKTIPVNGIELQKSLKLTEGETKLLKATISPENATNQKVTWSSSDNSIVTVENGLVKAVKAGKATITVTTADGGKKATCEVTITAKTVSVKDVKLDNSNLKLTEGETAQLKETVLPETATNKKVTWKSNDNNVATVENGLVKAVKAGKATITVTTLDDGITAKCEVNVIAKIVPVKGVELDKREIELTEGETAQLKETVSPADATNKNVTWKSNDNNVATVENGLVKAVKVGKATITVTTLDGGITTKCEVDVIAKTISVESIQLDKEKLVFTADEDYYQLTATISPENATNKKITWKSSDKNVAWVRNGLVTPMPRSGTATITATTKDGGKTATCEVIVNWTPVESVQLDKKELKLAEGETAQLKATVLPKNASCKKVIWNSHNKNVATVDENGLVKAVSPGTTTIAAIVEIEGKEATCEINVIAKPESVQLDKKDLKLVVGGNEQLTATILPENAANKKVTWISSDPLVAKVDQTGLVTAGRMGSTTITVKTEDGGKTATCEVNVFESVSVGIEKNQDSNLVGNKNITWESSDTSIATITVDGKGMRFLAPGDVTFTAKNNNGEIVGVLRYHVEPKKG